MARWLGHGQWEAWTHSQGLPSDLVWSIRGGRKGALWVGTSWAWPGLERHGAGQNLDEKGWLRGRQCALAGRDVRRRDMGGCQAGQCCTHRSGHRRDQTGGCSERPHLRDVTPRVCHDLGRLWIATSCGVFRNDRPTVSDQFHSVDQPSSLDHGAWAFSEDQQGTMWITNVDGLMRVCLTDGGGNIERPTDFRAIPRTSRRWDPTARCGCITASMRASRGSSFQTAASFARRRFWLPIPCRSKSRPFTVSTPQAVCGGQR